MQYYSNEISNLIISIRGVNVHETRDTDLIDPSRSHRYLRINLFFADLRPIPARLIEATIRESRSIKFTMRV